MGTAGRLQPQLHPERAPAGRVLHGAEPEALVEREGRGVGLVRVQLHPRAATLTGALGGGERQPSTDAGATGALEDEQVLQPAVLGLVPEPVAVAQLADPD